MGLWQLRFQNLGISVFLFFIIFLGINSGGDLGRRIWWPQKLCKSHKCSGSRIDKVGNTGYRSSTRPSQND